MNKLRPLKVMDRYFVYDELTSAHSEVDSKAWSRLCRAREEGSGAEGADISPPRCNVLGLKNIILQISHSCNLQCKYCSADFGRYGGDSRVMTLNTAKRAIDLLFDTSSSSELAITYFGGEPLLNLETVLESARYFRDKAKGSGRESALHLVTNGVLLDAKTLQALDRLGFGLTVSLDGPPEHHDVYRPRVNGKGSYASTAEALRAAADLSIGNRITVRGTFTRRSAYFFPLLKFLVEEKFSRNIAYEPVFLPQADPLAIRWKDLPEIKRAYTDLAKYYAARLKQKDPFCLWDLDDAITQLSLQKPRHSRCGSGATTVALTAEGDIYGCHMSTGIKDAWLGDLDDGFARDKKQPWEDVYMKGRAGCSDCWIRALCGGGCNTHAISYNGDISSPYRLECELIKHRYRLALWILAQFPEVEAAILAANPKTGKKRDSGHALVPIWHYMES